MSIARSVGRSVLIAVVILGVTPSAVRAQQLDSTTEAAVFLLRDSMRVRKDNRHVRYLRALRLLHDPALERFFRKLTESRHTVLRVHGILGLAECSPKENRIELELLTEMDNARLQQFVTTLAMDQKLLSVDQATQLMVNRPDLPESVRMAVATFLMKHKAEPDAKFLEETVRSDNVRWSSLAALLLAQRGNAEALEQLEALSQSNTPQRDKVRSMLLQTAFTSEFDRVGDWALSICTEPADRGTSEGLRRLALRVALRFGAPGAVAVWQQHYESAADDVQRLRIALIALSVAHWNEEKLFDLLIRSGNELMRQIGRIGAAVASRQAIAEAVTAAIELNNWRISDWAYVYARDHAIDEDALRIMLGLILTIEGPARSRGYRLQRAVTAAATLADRDVTIAAALLAPMLKDPEMSLATRRAILLGLVQCQKNDPYLVIKGVKPFGDDLSDYLVLLITAKSGQKLSTNQNRDLLMIVEGGVNFPADLRLQAAWAYLKLTGRTEEALAAVLNKP